MAQVVAVRRPRRETTPVEIDTFTDHVEGALRAFGRDVTYAVSIARSAVVIHRKRRVWQERRDLAGDLLH
jgi:hypothetical protein